MTILGIDTATDHASVALVQDGKIIAERSHPEPNGKTATPKKDHSETIVPFIESLLAQSQIAFGAIAGIAVSIGPGSFTGVRIGLGTAKGLAYGSNVTVVGISTLHASAADIACSEAIICPLLDARKKEVYVAIFRCQGAQLERLTGDMVAPVSVATRIIAEYSQHTSCLLLGSGAQAYAADFHSALGDQIRIAALPRQQSVAAAVARLGWHRIMRGEADDSAELLPVYVRPSEAESKTMRLL